MYGCVSDVCPCVCSYFVWCVCVYVCARAAAAEPGSALAPPPNVFSTPKKCPFSKWKGAPKSKTCTFWVIFKSLNAIFATDVAQLYREGTKWAKGYFMPYGAFSLSHYRALIATAEPGIIFPVNLSHCPWRGTVKGGKIRGPGALAPKKFQDPKSAPFLSKTCHFKVKNAPSLLRKRTFPQYFVSLSVLFILAHYGAQLL